MALFCFVILTCQNANNSYIIILRCKKVGRKDKYKEMVQPYLEDINKKIKEGCTERQIANSLGISISTLNGYKTQHQELVDALTKNKGVEALEALVNAGIESAKGYYKENETTVIILDEYGNATKRQKTINKVWYPPNPTLHLFYVKHFGKDEGFVSDPLEYELKKAKADLDEAIAREKNWTLDLENKQDK